MPPTLLPFLVALSFAAGLNLYATTATLGLLAHFHLVTLPPGLTLLDHPWIIITGILLFACEFFADKIPFVDLLWNFAHTFIRIPAAAFLAYRATTQLSPAMQALVVALAALITTLTHSAKTATRAAVTPSPEPVSNIALSSIADFASIAITWLATRHPVPAAIAAVIALIAFAFAARSLWRGLRRGYHRLLHPAASSNPVNPPTLLKSP